jgi:hypothetical protein
MDMQVALSDLGFSPVLTTGDHPFDGDFCSGLFWPCSDRDGKNAIVHGSKPGRVLVKGFWCIQADARPLAWARGVALGMRHDTHHIPVVRALVRRVLQLTEGVQAVVVRNEFKFHASQSYEANNDTFYCFHRRYGLSPDHVAQLEDTIEQLPLHSRWWHPLLERILDDCEQDWHGPTVAPGSLSALIAPLVGMTLNVAISPILEEMLKHSRRGTFATWAIIGIEAYCHWVTRGVPGLIFYAPTALMHYATSQLPIRQACWIHILWNSIAVGGLFG